MQGKQNVGKDLSGKSGAAPTTVTLEQKPTMAPEGSDPTIQGSAAERIAGAGVQAEEAKGFAGVEVKSVTAGRDIDILAVAHEPKIKADKMHAKTGSVQVTAVDRRTPLPLLELSRQQWDRGASSLSAVPVISAPLEARGLNTVSSLLAEDKATLSLVSSLTKGAGASPMIAVGSQQAGGNIANRVTIFNQPTFVSAAPSVVPSSAQKEAKAILQDWHLPSPNDHYFVGREAELKQLREAFKAKKDTQAVVLSAVSGLGGVGKTQLAIYHIHHPEQPYALRLWFQAETETTLLNDYWALAKHGQLPLEDKAPKEEVIHAVKQYLAQYPSWLAVYDNAGSHEAIKEFLPTAVKGGHLIITTRRRTEYHHLGAKIDVNVFSEVEAIAYVKKVLQRGEVLIESEETALKALTQEIGYLPLALAQAGAYIEKCGKSITDYLTLYRTYTADMLVDKTLPPNSHTQPVAITWNMSLQAIQEDEGKAGDPPLSLPLLQAMAYLHPHDIPRSLLARWLQRLPATPPEKAIELLFDKATGHLLDYSMIQAHTEQKTLSVHRLVQEVVRSQLVKEEKEELKASDPLLLPDRVAFLARLAESTTEEFNRKTDVLTDEDRQRALLPHMQTLDAHYKPLAASPSSLASLLGCIGNVLVGQIGEPYQAKTYYERALKIIETHYDSKHIKVAVVLGNLACAWGALGKAKEQKAFLERALKIKEAHYGSDHWQVASTLDNLATARGDLGDVGTQKALLERALKIKEAHYGPDHWQVAMTLNNLANACGALGDAKTQKTLLGRALKIKEAHYGSDHWQVGMTVGNLAIAYQALGNMEQALHHATRAHRIFVASYENPEHPRIQQAVALLQELQLLQRRPPHAPDLKEPALARLPRSPQDVIALCQPEIVSLLQKHDTETARYYFEAQGVNFEDPAIHLQIADHYQEQKQLIGTIVHKEQALFLLPEGSDTAAKRSALHQELASLYQCHVSELKQTDKPLAEQQALDAVKQHFEKSIQLFSGWKSNGTASLRQAMCYLLLAAYKMQGNRTAFVQVLEAYAQPMKRFSAKPTEAKPETKEDKLAAPGSAAHLYRWLSSAPKPSVDVKATEASPSQRLETNAEEKAVQLAVEAAVAQERDTEEINPEELAQAIRLSLRH